jgi:hypothetical protein
VEAEQGEEGGGGVRKEVTAGEEGGGGGEENNKNATLTCTNLQTDGRLIKEDEVMVDWVWKTMGLGEGLGGLLTLQDLRATQEQGVSMVKGLLQGRDTTEGGVETPMSLAYATMEPMEGRMEEGGEKLMGGVMVGAWGALSGQFQILKEGKDKYGRWVAGLLRGKEGRCKVVVSCYRAPGLAGSPGGLVARELMLRGWECNATGAQRVRDAFFKELGDLVAMWKGKGWEVMLCGDFNISEALRPMFRTWLRDNGLLDGDEGAGGEGTYFYRHDDQLRSSTLDFIVATPEILKVWTGDNRGVQTLRVAEREMGHRALQISGGGNVLKWLGIGGKRRLWRKQKKAAQRGAHKRRGPPRIDKDREEAYQQAVEERVGYAELDEMLLILTGMGEWGRGLWKGRKTHTEEVLFLRPDGTLGRAEAFPPDVLLLTERPVVVQHQHGDKAAFVGWSAVTIMDYIASLVTRCETLLSTPLIEGAWTLGKKDAPPLSRRKHDGWYEDIGNDRQAVRQAVRVLSTVTRGEYTVGRAEVARLQGLGCWMGPELPEVDEENLWNMWRLGLEDTVVGLKRRLQGSMRRATRVDINKAVEKRETAFQKRSLRKVVGSVMGTAKGGARLETVTTAEGEVLVQPEEVKAAASAFFQEMFDGAGTTPWFKESEGGATVEHTYEDSPRGREAREKILRGEEEQAWAELDNDQRTILRMLKLKTWVKPGDSTPTTAQEGWFREVLGEITEVEWDNYWGGKGRFTSAGDSGLRPDLVKSAPRGVHARFRQLYSLCLGMKIIPEQWRKSIVVPIPKKPGATALGDLRPLKLLEITRKAAMGIFKDRLRVVIDEHGLLHFAQHAFLRGKGTDSAAMLLLNATEEAVRYKKELHLLCLDIRKAYDTVIRTVGVEGAMRRMGIPMEACELMMECERRNKNDVRTVWDPILEVEDFLFAAERGFVQGAAVSPLLWLLFYDMVLEELQREGVGESMKTDTGHHTAGGGG